jgi:formylglycine-generating enzyme required for sulfatase activity
VPGQTQFYRIVREDTDPPVITTLVPAADAIAVVSNAQVMIYLDDQTGIDTNTISLSIGSWTNLTLADNMVTWSNQTLTFNPTSVLGEAEAVISNALTVADMLGHTLSNYTWTFQLDHPTVATNAFLPLVAPPPGSGPQVLSINGVPRMRTLPGIAPLSGEDEYHIVTVTSNTVVFAYTTTPPSIPAGTHLVSFDAAYPFYRDALSNSVDGGEQEITVWTTNIPLTDLMSEGALISSEFVSGVPLALQGAAAQGAGNLLHVTFGDDLSGKVLYDQSGLKLHLLDGSSWGFVGDVDVALDIAFDLWSLSTELRSLDTSASGKLTLDISPEAIFHYAVTDDGSTPLVPPVTHIFGAMAGPIPVWVEVTMELNAGYEYSASVSGDAHTTVFAEKEVTFYVRLRDNEWTHGVENPPIVLEADPITWHLEGEANVVVYIQPKLTVLVYSLAGLWADIKPYTEFDGWYQLNPLEYEQAVYLGISSTLGIESRIWYDGWGAKPEWELFDWKEMIWSDSYPSDVPPMVLSGFPDRTVLTGNSLTLSGYADGTPAPTYKWYYNGSSIVGETGPEYEIASTHSGHAGTYSVRAQNGSGSVIASCVVTVTSGSAPSGMAYIPAGSFSMGDNLGDGYSEELPVHSVYVSSFYMDKYEVTNDKMVEVMQWAYNHGKLTVTSSSVRNAEGNAQELLDLDNSDCRITWSGSSFGMKAAKGSGYPCVEVTWYGSAAFCNYRSQMEGRTACYDLSDWSCNFAANGYRLPTEAEWEKAARGGLSGQRFPWGATIQHTRANYYSSTSYSYDTSSTRGYHHDYDDGGYPYTSPVDTFAANGYGLYDMSGNVWEWCNDWYGSSYYGSSPGSNPHGPTSGSVRVNRGGSWGNIAYGCRVAYRYSLSPGYGYVNVGFRACLPRGQ